MPELMSLEYNSIFIEMKNRLLKAGKPKILIVGTAIRQLTHIIYGVLKNNQLFNASFRLKVIADQDGI